ncbi:MAG: peptidase M15 [Acidocella sp. 20-57-95]|nr:MAG: peptidase M15 [Acidocella sp. 20-57-95]OYV59397.1 MAG: peptidase M15 [Acidocella sp. 21-58-7]
MACTTPLMAQAAKKTHHAGAAAAKTSDDPEKATATPMPTGPVPVPDSPIADKNTPAPPTLPDMTAYVLMDATTGAILAEAAPNLQVAPASLTKLMTAHIAFQALHHGSLKPDQTVPVSPAAWHAGGSRMFIDTTSVVTVDQLLHGLIIDSGNDAAVALAEQIAGSQGTFVQMMTKDAADMGLTNTVYTNVTGLPDPAMHTTALDVAQLSRVILQDEPEFLDISKQQSYTFNNITQASWNPVLQHDPTVDGMKTGLTDESGHCIDATAIRGGRRLIAVVMGGPTWHNSTAAIESILNYGEKFFTNVTLGTPGTQIDTLQSASLDAGQVAVGVGQSAVLTLPADEAGQVTHSVTYTADVSSGVRKGEVLGTIDYTLAGKTIASLPAVALADAPAASWTTKLSRAIKKML